MSECLVRDYASVIGNSMFVAHTQRNRATVPIRSPSARSIVAKLSR